MTERILLENAASEVISILKGIPEFSHARVAVIGGLALWKYVPTGRTTEDVDFIINIDSAPHGIKQKLLSLPNSPFVQQAQFFYYKQGTTLVQVDITPGWQSPYMPAAATEIGRIPHGSVPYISPTDLIVFKINSCGLRAQVNKKRTDALDAVTLLELETRNGPLTLNSAQRAVVEQCIADVVAHGPKNAQWWKQRLGLR
ncbi:uncharacterized protein BDZ83DRAFT_50569 [Colletotrichum acutatum]|uniref:Uncharacterized protein n=1 Tax=Glomerella acutata TaxID=27357 RepID=A0AAD9CZF5_GLOAC|nr:uncharacterized protein BDZ83DRAFT_50569 [Colletotrichum acutatum]KAK1729322.1 hypothetical protein BDZ83DRAFT_50569 [Colletotrichum acutatum]